MANIITIKKNGSSFSTKIAPGAKGEDVLFSVACLMQDIIKHEKQFQPDYGIDDLLGSVEFICHQLSKEDK